LARQSSAGLRITTRRNSAKHHYVNHFNELVMAFQLEGRSENSRLFYAIALPKLFH